MNHTIHSRKLDHKIDIALHLNISALTGLVRSSWQICEPVLGFDIRVSELRE